MDCVIEKILGVDLHYLCNDGNEHIISITDFKNSSESTLTTCRDEKRIPVNKIDIHLECDQYSYYIDCIGKQNPKVGFDKFKNIKDCLFDFEMALHNVFECDYTKKDKDTVEYFNLHLAEALMKNEYVDHEKLAKIIIAFSGIKENIQLEIK